MDPVLQYLLPIEPEAASLGRWTRTHDYDVWTDCRPAADPPLTLFEARDKGVVRIPDTPTLMHVVRSGVPHHIAGLFGYWRQSDSDIIFLRAARGEWVHYALVVGGEPAAYRTDRILWICPACGERLAAREFATGPKGIERFWRAEREAIVAFNADMQKRTCPTCGHVHPPAYAFRKAGVADAPPPEVAW